MIKIEIWKEIYFEENGIIWDYRGLYSVSNEGRVKSFRGNRGQKREKILKPNTDKDGYHQVILCKNKHHKAFRVHRLVAHMFCEGYFENAEVDHINTNPSDNRANNLRWVTIVQNKNNPLSLSKKSGKNNYCARRVAQYDLQGNLIRTWDCIKEAGKELGIPNQSISACCRGKIKQTHGFIWKYLEED